MHQAIGALQDISKALDRNELKKNTNAPAEKGKSSAQKLLEQKGIEAAECLLYFTSRGDIKAAKCVLEHITPRRKPARIRLDLPEVATVKDVVASTTKVVEAVAAGRISPQEGVTTITLLKECVKMFQLTV